MILQAVRARLLNDGAECQTAFDQLKEALMSPPVLVLPTKNDQFILDTDDSQQSIGAVLSVLRDGREYVVLYAGWTLNKNELNYCVTHKELLAIVQFTRHFRQYLLGSRSSSGPIMRR